MKRLFADRSWLGEATGRAVKNVSPPHAGRTLDAAAAAAAVDAGLHRQRHAGITRADEA